ncbi:phospholipase B1, membrane-associated-like [Liolophura sinensis]|uniref:phospholipase B1, membrane-associated-like n=1 Tax=Liolophura sinensis TaxID=3198878 RepID=UPI0031585991
MKVGIVKRAVVLCLVVDLMLADDSVHLKWPQTTKQLMKFAANSTLQQAFQDHVKKYGTGKLSLYHQFPCAPLANQAPATSVHRLSPVNVGVVAALGDSLTAGTGVKALTIIGLLREWRGLSWSGGGDLTAEEAPTLPNFIKKYNPNVKGFSVKTGSYESRNAHLNVADPGAVASDMPGQAKLLVECLKTEPGVDFENDWKVITLFIGGNDLCDYCEDQEKFSATNYLRDVQAALDTLHDSVPRAFVNLVQVLTVPMVEELNKGLICYALHLYACKCGAFPKDDAARQEMIAAGVAYRKAVEDLVLSGRYDDREDFTVVLQPFLTETRPPRDPNNEPDLSYFAPDCFHFSEKGQAAAAEGLWNNMIEPEGQKRTSWTPGEQIICPTDATPFFFTRQNTDELNSKMGFQGSKGAFFAQDKEDSQALNGALSAQNKQDSPPKGQGANISPSVVVLGCLIAIASVALALGISLKVRKSRQQRNPENVGILLHSMGSAVYT